MAQPQIHPPKMKLEDFELGNVLGEGSYATVFYAIKKDTNQEFAIKRLAKQQLITLNKMQTVVTEKNVMLQLDHHNIVKLLGTFSDADFLYMVLEFVGGGEVFQQIKLTGALKYEVAQFYAAEVVNALEYLHSKGIVHRDLKPENLLVNTDGHIKMTDFGTAKLMREGEIGGVGAKGTFCGTAEYVSPEMLNHSTAGEMADYWALGCIVFHMLAGHPPFKAPSEYLVFQKIIKAEFFFPDGFSEQARDLVSRLLVVDPPQRLGARGVHEIKSHPFFEDVDFDTLHLQPGPPPVLINAQDEEGDADDQALPAGTMPSRTTGRQSFSNAHLNPEKHWVKFLINTERKQEHILLSGILHKRRGLFAKRRVFLLTDFPRIIYIDKEKMEKKGEIQFSERMRTEKKTSSVFLIHTPGRTYHLEDPSNQAQRWCDAVADLVRTHVMMMKRP
eukprot:TRINITY_DN6645_c0_g1_i2.p1 TRINITY_DN6645_c0_g1~~TRINITY_DN6645_c0_g1_i2.p1  ORF type:complete len:445 (-),score=105.48 TRINITY_DN6645_c0_g1_i2:16-1350(-)